MNKLAIAGLSLLAMTAVAAPAAAAETVTAELRGRTQGVISGDSTMQKAAGQIDVLHLELSGTAPFDAASGMASGKRKWSPLKFVKPLDKASPKIFTAFATNETLTTAKFHVWGRSTMDGTVGYYTIELTNAVVQSDQIILPTDKDPATGAAYSTSVEVVSLTFQKITVTFVAGGIKGDDTWM